MVQSQSGISSNAYDFTQQEQAKVDVIIVGAGATGLLLAQGLKKNGLSYSIHEKEAPSHRPRDWGMSYFWSADYLPKLLPENIVSRLQEAQVNPHRPNPVTQTMIVTNGATGKTIKEVPSPGGRRVGRRAFRKLLAEGIDVHYDHHLSDIEYCSSGVIAHFKDGSTQMGGLLIGADGGGSKVRRLLLGEKGEPVRQPFEFANFNATYTAEQSLYLLKNLKPFVDHGIHPKGMFFLMCLQNVRDQSDPSTWSWQITISFSPSLLPDDLHASLKWQSSSDSRLALLKRLTSDFAEPKRSAIAWLAPATTDIPSDRIAIWEPESWDNKCGRVTLAGDAAHAMTFHRGQGLNNCIRDSSQLLDAIVGIKMLERIDVDIEEQRKSVIDGYDAEVVDRGGAEVRLSKKQMFCAHDWATWPQSPIMAVGGAPVRPVDHDGWRGGETPGQGLVTVI